MYFYLVYFTSFEYRGPAEFQDTLDLPERGRVIVGETIGGNDCYAVN